MIESSNIRHHQLDDGRLAKWLTGRAENLVEVRLLGGPMDGLVLTMDVTSMWVILEAADDPRAHDVVDYIAVNDDEQGTAQWRVYLGPRTWEG